MTVETGSIAADTVAGTQEVWQALEQVLSLIATAERLLAEGQGVNIARLDRRVAAVCEAVAALPRVEGRRFAPALDHLLGGLDRLEAATQRSHALMLETAAPIPDGADGPTGLRANAAYRRTLEASGDAPPAVAEPPADDR
jgi:hypothetical protein